MASNIPILQIGNRLIVPIHGNLHDRLVLELQREILIRIEQTSAAGLLLDISALDFVDSFMARVLSDTARMARLMATEVVVTGISPPIAIILMELGLQMAQVPTARNLEKGLEFLDGLIAAAEEETIPGNDDDA